MKTDRQLLEEIQNLARTLGAALADLRADQAKLDRALPAWTRCDPAQAKFERDRAALESKTEELVSDLHLLGLNLQRLGGQPGPSWPASVSSRSLN